MVFSFIPVLVNLLVYVNYISFLQWKFPVKNALVTAELCITLAKEEQCILLEKRGAKYVYNAEVKC